MWIITARFVKNKTYPHLFMQQSLYNMKAIVIQPKNSSEYRFIADLLKNRE
jgi:hypothetical protein